MALVRPSPIRQRVFSKAVKQQGKAHTEAEDCAICMVKFGEDDEGGQHRRQRSLLSCTHVFHEACLCAFENFNDGPNSCPLCRAVYSKIRFEDISALAMGKPHK